MPFFVLTNAIDPFPPTLPAGAHYSITTYQRVLGPFATLLAAASAAEQDRGS